MLRQIAERAERRGITLTFSKTAEKRLCEDVSGEDMGARPLRRKITSAIEDMLSRKIVEGDLRHGCRAEVVERDGAFDVLIFQDTKAG